MQPGIPGPSEPVPPPPPMPTAPAKKFNGKIIGGLILVLVALIMALVALVGVWWGLSMKASVMGVTMEAKMEMGLSQACATMPGFGSNCTAYSTPGMTNVQGVMNLSYYMTILGLVMAILTLVLIFVGAGKPKLKAAVLMVGIIGAILLLVAVIMTFSGLPDAFNKDMAASGGGAVFPTVSGFFGSTTMNLGGASAEVSYGGGIGWMMALVAFILLLVGSLMATMGMKSKPAPTM